MTAGPPNDRTYKDDVRREWTAAATGWRKWIGTIEAEGAGPMLTSALLQQAGVGRGDHVLDVGSGYGEPGLSAAQAVGPTGHVTCLDISADMLAFAKERSRSCGLDNVTFVEGDVETTQLEPEGFDVVLSRATLMYAADPLATLQRLKAALRPGGRLAIAVWATPDQVAFATPVPVMVDMLGIDPPGCWPGPFRPWRRWSSGDARARGWLYQRGVGARRSSRTRCLARKPVPSGCVMSLRRSRT